MARLQLLSCFFDPAIFFLLVKICFAGRVALSAP